MGGIGLTWQLLLSSYVVMQIHSLSLMRSMNLNTYESLPFDHLLPSPSCFSHQARFLQRHCFLLSCHHHIHSLHMKLYACYELTSVNDVHQFLQLLQNNSYPSWKSCPNIPIFFFFFPFPLICSAQPPKIFDLETSFFGKLRQNSLFLEFESYSVCRRRTSAELVKQESGLAFSKTSWLRSLRFWQVCEAVPRHINVSMSAV